MTVDLKWRDAIASAPRNRFDAVERETGWRESMKPEQLAAFQRPLVNGDLSSKKRQENLSDEIRNACMSGALSHTVTTRQVHVTVSRRFGVPLGVDVNSGKLRFFDQFKSYDVNIYHIEAAPFAEWLRKQGEEPSQHIANWFKVRGVASGAQVLELAKPDADEPQDATNDRWWSDWCTRRNAANTLPDGSTKRGRAREGWKDEDLQVLGLRRKALMGQSLSESAAKTSMASDLEMTTQALEKQLEKLVTSEAETNNQAVQKVN